MSKSLSLAYAVKRSAQKRSLASSTPTEPLDSLEAEPIEDMAMDDEFDELEPLEEMEKEPVEEEPVSRVASIVSKIRKSKFR